MAGFSIRVGGGANSTGVIPDIGCHCRRCRAELDIDDFERLGVKHTGRILREGRTSTHELELPQGCPQCGGRRFVLRIAF